ncbi:uncharacterized protein SOCE26_099670 [Sorangium cellulosum]|uniref:Secreted protein n=1 Tax=Sorangium cellulosum TaxID=56 RepID=A0A2L0FA61_SORCE|nr:hypothetical protein [Sorangium cellulosum]AUX48433.1 uncharacterized protein SOCE26_099670 [Sorangium cellulosum]
MCCRNRLASPLLMSIAIAACGGRAVVYDEGTGAGGEGGAAAGSASAAASSGGSTSAAASSGGGLDPATTSASSASGGFVECPVVLDHNSFWLEVLGDGPSQKLQRGCREDPMPLIQIVGGGECGYGVSVRACAAPDGGAALALYAPGLLEPGASDEAIVRYRDEDGVAYEAMAGQLLLDELGDVSSIGRGSYSATVVSTADGTTTLSISGGFMLCRVPDGPPCP